MNILKTLGESVKAGVISALSKPQAALLVGFLPVVPEWAG